MIELILIILSFTTVVDPLVNVTILKNSMLFLIYIYMFYYLVRYRKRCLINNKKNILLWYMIIIMIKNIILLLIGSLNVISMSKSIIYTIFIAFIFDICRYEREIVNNIIKKYFYICLIINILEVLNILDIFNVNVTTFMMMPYVILNYNIIKFNKLYVMVIIMLSYLLEARNVTLCMIAWFIFFVIFKIQKIKQVKIIRVLLVNVIICSLMIIGFIANNNNPGDQMNDLLSRRPIIWDYYIGEVSNNNAFILGNGPLSKSATEKVGDILRTGVGYSPHSTYICQYYENGVLACLFITVFIIYILISSEKYIPLLYIILIYASIDTFNIGAPNTYSFIIMFTLAMIHSEKFSKGHKKDEENFVYRRSAIL